MEQVLARILIIASLGESLSLFRGDLIRDWIAAGHVVFAAAPGEEAAADMTKLGARFRSIPMRRTGLNPFQDLSLVAALIRLIRKLRPDFVFLYTIKPVIYGSLAARLRPRSRVFSMITGAGYFFTDPSGWRRRLRGLVVLLYRVALSRNEKVFFQNRDDAHEFACMHIVDRERVVMINGSGVDTDAFACLPASRDPVVFLLIARLLREKGIVEYIEAAAIVKKRYPRAVFRMVGWQLEKGPSAIGEDLIEAWRAEGVVEITGYVDDVRPHLAAASVYVLPSYREGTPRTVLEAMSMGRPVITTDAPGCRETVDPGVNGLLVPVRDGVSLAEAMQFFLQHPDSIAEMGVQSRRICEQKYDVRKVNREINRAMGLRPAD
jgi:glycosyltransferase involved in cell wall biosynthesis